MKWLLFCLLMIFGAISYSQAQNWACFYPHDTAYYLDDAGNLRGLLAIDSTVSGNDVHYKIYRTVKDERCSNQIYSVNTNGPIWVGGEIHKLAAGTYRFFNSNYQPITIEPLAGLGDSWEFYRKDGSSYINATVTAMDTATVKGVLDSVKTINLSAIANGDTSISKWDGVVLRLSKSHGMVTLPAILDFPNQQTMVNITAEKPLTYRDVYAYEVGDYFQVKHTYWQYASPTRITLTEYYVIDKVLSNGGETVTFTYSREVQQTTTSGVPSIVTDTLTKVIDSLSNYVHSGLPDLVFENPDSSLYSPILNAKMYIINNPGSLLNGHKATEEVRYLGVRQASDTCWGTAFVIDGYEWTTFYGCLGSLTNSFGIDNESVNEFVYYNVCGKQAGIKQYLSIPELPETQVKIYPNPANNLLEIDNASNVGYRISIANLQGQVVHTLNAGAAQSTTVNVSNLAQGIYIIRLEDEANAYFKKLVIAR